LARPQRVQAHDARAVDSSAWLPPNA
jgi:hypothetical protein